MKIAFGNDHAATDIRAELIAFIESLGHEVVDCGYAGAGKADYPRQAELVCKAVMSGEAEQGVLVCGTGIGMSIAANKVRGIRCAHCTDTYSARMAREHNDANIIAVGARITGIELIKDIIDMYLRSSYSHRYDARIKMMSDMEG